MSLWRRRTRLHMLILTFVLFVSLFLLISLHLDSSSKKDISVPGQHRTHKERFDITIRKKNQDIAGEFLQVIQQTENTITITDDDININRYSPISSAGRLGEAYYVLPSEMQKAKALFHINNFNLLVSDRIPVGRSLRDVRSIACRRKTYNRTSLPDTSVVIVFHNEAWSTLMRTVYSVIKRSPRNLLREIILVDDASEREYLKKPLDDYVSRLPVNITVVRSVNRTGLIRARLLGAEAAKGKILTFLDAHCECNHGWLEPLLARIAENRSNVVCPVIDIIDEDTFAYVPSSYLQNGGFKWDLTFRWYPVERKEHLKRKRKKNLTAPLRSPIMAGGLFSIDRSYFKEIGKYDDQMDIFGGENIEMSLRVWQCGGSVEIIPCSHVGHVFRTSLPYKFPRSGGLPNVYYTNIARAVSTWMDGWANFFFKLNPEVANASRSIDVSSRRSLRERLKCRSFSWYLENVWPQHFFPTQDRFFGKIRNGENGKCIQVPTSSGKVQPVGKVKVKDCASDTYLAQLFVFTDGGRIMADDSVCVDAPLGVEESFVVTLACFQTKTQFWIYDSNSRTIARKNTDLCLDLHSQDVSEDIVLRTCDSGSTQEWIFEKVDWSS